MSQTLLSQSVLTSSKYPQFSIHRKAAEFAKGKFNSSVLCLQSSAFFFPALLILLTLLIWPAKSMAAWQYTLLYNADTGAYNNTSIAIDSSGNSHVSTYGKNSINTSNWLEYATNLSGSWVLTTIDSAAKVGQYTSITIDSSDKAHISYYDTTNSRVKYAVDLGDPIPTLSEWGMIIFMLLIGMTAVYYLRRKKEFSI